MDQSKSFAANPANPISDQDDRHLIAEQLAGFDRYRREQANHLPIMAGDDDHSWLNHPRNRKR